MTTNHGYATPPKGTTDWHIPVNENFEKLDTDIEIRDEERAIDGYEPKAGAKFLATDSGAVYIGSGDAWTKLGELSSGGSSDTAGGTSVSQLCADGFVVPVCNGISIADAAIHPTTTSTPIQDAIDVCAASEGGDVYLPPTTIRTPGNIQMSHYVSLYGTYGATRIELTEPSNDLLVYDASVPSYGNNIYITGANLDGLWLRGPGIGTTSGVAIADHGRWQCHVGQIGFHEWNGNIWDVTGRSFGNSHDEIIIDNCDCGNETAFITWGSGDEAGAAPNWYGLVSSHPTDSHTEELTTFMRSEGGARAVFGYVDHAGHCGPVFEGPFGMLWANHVNWEPEVEWAGSSLTWDDYDPITAPIKAESVAVNIRSLEMWNEEVEYAYQTWGLQNSYLARPTMQGEAAVRGNYIHARGGSNPDRPVIWEGHSGQIDEDQSGDADGYAALGDLAPGNN